jgi:hypothetical protein
MVLYTKGKAALFGLIFLHGVEVKQPNVMETLSV